jgi:hypothetical protein
VVAITEAAEAITNTPENTMEIETTVHMVERRTERAPTQTLKGSNLILMFEEGATTEGTGVEIAGVTEAVAATATRAARKAGQIHSIAITTSLKAEQPVEPPLTRIESSRGTLTKRHPPQ